MKSISRAAILLLLIGLLGAPALQAATLEGRWKLVEQHVGSGGANLASPDSPPRLEFVLSGPSLTGRIWTAEKNPRAFPWPSFTTAKDAPPVQVDRVVISPAGDLARAVYRVKGPTDKGWTLRVEEEYRLAEEGKALLGTVTLTTLEDGSPAGSYQIHRRFEREP